MSQSFQISADLLARAGEEVARTTNDKNREIRDQRISAFHLAMRWEGFEPQLYPRIGGLRLVECRQCRGRHAALYTKGGVTMRGCPDCRQIEPNIVPLKHSVAPLVAAIAEYDRGAAGRAALWQQVETAADVAAAEDAEESALRPVRDAFYEATRDRNSRASCERLDIWFMRKIAMAQSPSQV